MIIPGTFTEYYDNSLLRMLSWLQYITRRYCTTADRCMTINPKVSHQNDADGR